MTKTNKRVFPPTSDYDTDKEDLRFTFVDRAGAHVKIDPDTLTAALFVEINTGSIPANTPVYVSSSNTVSVATNNAIPKAFVLGFVSEANKVQVCGVLDGFTGLTPGRAFLGEGNVTATPPTDDGDTVVEVGTALSTTRLLIRPNPIAVL
jgi:hypothetical protein